MLHENACLPRVTTAVNDKFQGNQMFSTRKPCGTLGIGSRDQEEVQVFETVKGGRNNETRVDTTFLDKKEVGFSSIFFLLFHPAPPSLLLGKGKVRRSLHRECLT